LTLLLALASALAFACAMIASNVGLRHMSARAGVTVSVPSATVLFWLTLPWLIEVPTGALPGGLIFLAIGLFFPAAVTLFVFEANSRVGPTIAATVSCTAPLFAVAAAVLVLGELLTLRVGVGTLIIVLGILILSTARTRGLDGVQQSVSVAGLACAIGAAALRAAAQIGLKFGFMFWPNPFAAILAGYAVSTAVILIASRWLGRQQPIVRSRRGVPWFMLAGVCNGSAMLLMYAALVDGEVSVVAPIVASYPLFTLLLSALLLGNERFGARQLAGIAATVGGVALLASR
jgi:drug/metabolite transporter (DMT)-like permease